jgi:thioredoxin-related protein
MAIRTEENVQFKGRDMKKYIHIFFILAFLFSIGIFYHSPQKTALAGDKETKNPSSTQKADSLIWHKYDEGLAKAKKEKKHVLVAFYTNWCGWCRRMDKSTYGDKEVKKVLNKDYVPIKVNAESKEKVEVDGKKITETELARQFRVRSYPITWFLKQSGEKIAPYLGYVDAQNFLKVLNYMKDDLYDKMSFDEYLKNQEKKENKEKKSGSSP